MLANQDKISIVIIDDHPVVIQGLQSLLQAETTLQIVACFTNGADAMAFFKNNEADVVLLDITLPDANGMDLCREIKKTAINTCVLALSNHSERSMITQMIQNGASGYLLKNASADEVIKSIHEALEGKITFSSEVLTILAKPTENDIKAIPPLTKREKEILRMIAQGKTSAVIAGQLFISPLTVETHRRNLMQKFDVANVAALIKAAGEHKLI